MRREEQDEEQRSAEHDSVVCKEHARKHQELIFDSYLVLNVSGVFVFFSMFFLLVFLFPDRSLPVQTVGT